jgi:hypothetical protein
MDDSASRDFAMDRDGFPDVRNMGSKLSANDFHRITVHLLIFASRRFFTRIGYNPSLMLCPSILADHHFAIHREIFCYWTSLVSYSTLGMSRVRVFSWCFGHGCDAGAVLDRTRGLQIFHGFT